MVLKRHEHVHINKKVFIYECSKNIFCTICKSFVLKAPKIINIKNDRKDKQLHSPQFNDNNVLETISRLFLFFLKNYNLFCFYVGIGGLKGVQFLLS